MCHLKILFTQEFYEYFQMHKSTKDEKNILHKAHFLNFIVMFSFKFATRM